MQSIRRRRGRPAPLVAGSGLASLVAVALMGAVDAAQGQEPASSPAPSGETTEAKDDGDVGDACDEDAGANPELHSDEEAVEACEVEEDEGQDDGSPDPQPKPDAPPPPPPPAEVDVGSPPHGGAKGGNGGAKGGKGDRSGGRGHGNRQGDRGKGGRGDRGKGGQGDRGKRAQGQSPDRTSRRSGHDSAGPTTSAYGGASTYSSAGAPAAIPAFLVPVYRECGNRYGIPWQVLAAINQVETAFGANLNISSAGATGWMQFLPSTWRSYGVDANGDGRRDPYDPEDAVCAAARYLRAAGAQEDLSGALFAYNHADWYVDLVLGLARQYERANLLEPLPRAKRLDRKFARQLARIARQNDVDWAVVLATLRAEGRLGGSPASAEQLRTAAEQVARAKRRTPGRRLGPLVRSMFEKRSKELKVTATARLHRAIGLSGLVEGLHAVDERLRRRVLDSGRLSIYAGGRDDVAAGRIDPRVLALLLYLADKYEGVKVTSLITGHGYFARPGVPSAHSFGRAVDIAAIRGTPILGNQEPGGVTEAVLRDILLLPKALQPADLISLIELGGPSFAAADHADHIHVGF